MQWETVLFWAGTGVLLVTTAISQTNWKHRILIGILLAAGAMSIIVAIAGAFGVWPYLSSLSPRLAGAISDIASHPASWFCVLILAAAANLLIRNSSQGTPSIYAVMTARFSGKEFPKQLQPDIKRIDDKIDRALANQIEANRNLDGMIGRVDDKADKIALNVQADIKNVMHSVQELKVEFERSYKHVGMGQLRIANALRARDAEAIIKEADLIVLGLGNKLFEAKPSDYKDAGAWLSDYAKWTAALGKIDSIVSDWQQTQRPFLDIRRDDYERPLKGPPSNVSSDLTLAPYKTLCVARDRYLEGGRAGVLNYFDAKARDI